MNGHISGTIIYKQRLKNNCIGENETVYIPDIRTKTSNDRYLPQRDKTIYKEPE